MVPTVAHSDYFGDTHVSYYDCQMLSISRDADLPSVLSCLQVYPGNARRRPFLIHSESGKEPDAERQSRLQDSAAAGAAIFLPLAEAS